MLKHWPWRTAFLYFLLQSGSFNTVSFNIERWSSDVPIIISLDGESLDVAQNIEFNIRSSTLKSNFTDYDTPPETPECKIDSGSSSLNSTLSRTSNKELQQTNGGAFTCPTEDNAVHTENIVSSGNREWGNMYLSQSQSIFCEERNVCEGDSGSPPVPPPRPRRRNKMKIKNLSLDSNDTLQEESHQNDILFRTDSSVRLNKDMNCLKGLLIREAINQYWKKS